MKNIANHCKINTNIQRNHYKNDKKHMKNIVNHSKINAIIYIYIYIYIKKVGETMKTYEKH